MTLIFSLCQIDVSEHFCYMYALKGLLGPGSIVTRTLYMIQKILEPPPVEVGEVCRDGKVSCSSIFISCLHAYFLSLTESRWQARCTSAQSQGGLLYSKACAGLTYLNLMLFNFILLLDFNFTDHWHAGLIYNLLQALQHFSNMHENFLMIWCPWSSVFNLTIQCMVQSQHDCHAALSYCLSTPLLKLLHHHWGWMNTR